MNTNRVRWDSQPPLPHGRGSVSEQSRDRKGAWVPRRGGHRWPAMSPDLLSQLNRDRKEAEAGGSQSWARALKARYSMGTARMFSPRMALVKTSGARYAWSPRFSLAITRQFQHSTHVHPLAARTQRVDRLMLPGERSFFFRREAQHSASTERTSERDVHHIGRTLSIQRGFTFFTSQSSTLARHILERLTQRSPPRNARAVRAHHAAPPPH